MQRRREIFSRHKTIKDINEDSGMSSRDLHSVDSDSYVKGMHEEGLSERVRNICVQSEKPPHSMPQMPTPTANRRPTTFSLPRIFTQKKKDVIPLAVPHLPSAADTVPAPVTSSSVDEHQQQPQLSPGTTTTTTSAYNTGVDTGQESPPANTKKQCSTVNTVSRTTALDGRNTVGGGGGAETTTTMTNTVPHPSMLPTLTPAAGARQATRKQHVRFKSDSVSCLPQAVFYTSAERLAETIATQQRLLHQELSISDFSHHQQQNQTGCLMMKQQNRQNQNNGTAQQKQLVQYLGHDMVQPQSTSNLQLVAQNRTKNQPAEKQQQFVLNANAAQKPQKVQQQQQQQQQYNVQPVQSYQQQKLQQYSNHNIPYVNPQLQIPQYPKDTTTLRYNPKNKNGASSATGQNEKQFEAQTNPQTGSLRRQQQQKPIQYSIPATKEHQQAHKQQQQQQHQLPKVGKILSAEQQKPQLQYAGTSLHRTQQQAQQQYRPIADNTKTMSLHRADKRMTAEDVFLIGHQQKHHSGDNLPTSSVCSGIATRWQCSKLAQNLPHPDWPRGTELAELFAFRPTKTATAFGHNKQQQHQPQLKQQQQREKRRGSPSKQISGQHRQQPELEWVIKRRPDGTRYVTRRPARKRTTPSLLAAVKARREQSLARERAAMSTTDDDGGSEAVANAGVIPKWWAQRTKRKPPPIPSAFSPSSLARKKPPTASDGRGTLIQVVPSDLQKAFTVTTV